MNAPALIGKVINGYCLLYLAANTKLLICIRIHLVSLFHKFTQIRYLFTKFKIAQLALTT